jgi:hypothetical protein
MAFRRTSLVVTTFRKVHGRAGRRGFRDLGASGTDSGCYCGFHPLGAVDKDSPISLAKGWSAAPFDSNDGVHYGLAATQQAWHSASLRGVPRFGGEVEKIPI